jgi:hypothetical protein
MKRKLQSKNEGTSDMSPTLRPGKKRISRDFSTKWFYPHQKQTMNTYPPKNKKLRTYSTQRKKTHHFRKKDKSSEE